LAPFYGIALGQAISDYNNRMVIPSPLNEASFRKQKGLAKIA
jgi:hypothetical protein